MAKGNKYPRWNPPYKPPSAIAGSYLERMSVVDPLVSRIELRLRTDIGVGHLIGLPINWDMSLQTNRDGSHYYWPPYSDPIPPGINSITEFLWAVSDEGFEPLTYAGILFVRNLSFIQFAGSIREWPQEDPENAVTSPWRQTWTFSMHNVAFPDRLSFYDVVPIPWDCSILD